MAGCGRGRPRNTISEDAEFFKVFLPHLSTHQLMIPPDFLKDYERTIKEKVILRDLGGKTWHVDVRETPDGVFLKDGWQSFVSYHGLNVGDFLVFRYDRCYSFVVKVFGRNGCKKEALAATKNLKNEVREEEMEAKQSSHKRTRADKEDHLSRDNERTGHSKRFREVNESREQNAAVRLPESSEELEDGERGLPKCPYFITPPIHSRKYKLRIPDEVINEHDLHLQSEMILRDADGEEWPVKTFTIYGGPTFIGSGWLAFQNENNVEMNDRCKLTFETDRLSRTINVQIIRDGSNKSCKTRRR